MFYFLLLCEGDLAMKKKAKDVDFEPCRFSRRKFLKTTGAIAASLALSSTLRAGETVVPGPRTGRSNCFVKDGKTLLVVVEGTDAEKMLTAGLEAVGGLEKVIRSGDSVLLKPNYGSHRAYPTGSDPHFLVSIANHCRSFNPCRITICDSSDAYVLNRFNDHEYVFKAKNVFEIGRAAGVEVICTHPKDEKLYTPVFCQRWEKNPMIMVNPHLLNASVLINQPMLKKHGAAHMTCALKNFFGAVHQPQRIYAHRHHRKGGKEGEDFFMKTVAEFADCIRPELTIVDARKILTVRGPSLKEGSVVKDVNKIIISADMVAADAYCAKILDAHDATFSAEQIATTLQYAEKLGLGTCDLSKVEIVEITV